MPDETILAGLQLDLGRLRSLAEAEILEFERNFPEERLSEAQEHRALSVALIFIFVPEAVTSLLLARVLRLLDRARRDPEWRGKLWYQCLPFEAAAFAFTGDFDHAKTLRANLDHEASVLRLWVMEVFGLVVDRFRCDDPDFLDRVLSNFRSMHFFCEHGAILLLSAKGDANEKRAALEKMRSIEEMNEGPRTLLDDAAEGRLIPNNHFLGRYAEELAYLALRLASTRPAAPAPAANDLPLFSDPTAVFSASTAFQRIQSHPLFRGFVEALPVKNS